MHALAGRARFPDPVDGRLFDINAWYGRLAAKKRLIAWHVKDADRIIPLPAPGHEPVHAGAGAAGLPAQRRHRRRVRRRGIDRPGLPRRPGPRGDRLPRTFDALRAQRPGLVPHRERHRPRAGATDPGRSLRWAKVSAEVHARPARGRRRDDCDDDDHGHHHGHGGTRRMRGLRALGAALIAALAVAPPRMRTATRRATTSRPTRCTRRSRSNRRRLASWSCSACSKRPSGAATRSRWRSWRAPRTWSTTSGCSGRRSAMRRPSRADRAAGSRRRC